MKGGYKLQLTRPEMMLRCLQINLLRLIVMVNTDHDWFAFRDEPPHPYRDRRLSSHCKPEASCPQLQFYEYRPAFETVSSPNYLPLCRRMVFPSSVSIQCQSSSTVKIFFWKCLLWDVSAVPTVSSLSTRAAASACLNDRCNWMRFMSEARSNGENYYYYFQVFPYSDDL